MSSERLYTFAGTSVKDKVRRVKCGNELSYFNNLEIYYGESDLVIVELPFPMTKVDAMLFIIGVPEFADKEHQQVINEFIKKHGKGKPRLVLVDGELVEQAVTETPKPKMENTFNNPSKQMVTYETLIDDADDAYFVEYAKKHGLVDADYTSTFNDDMDGMILNDNDYPTNIGRDDLDLLV